jgi:hypothetical protein
MVVCGYGLGFYLGYIIGYVRVVGYIVFNVYVSGFYPPYYMICCCCYFIFAFGANIFRRVLPWDIGYLCVSLIVARASYSSTYCASTFSADSTMSAAGGVASSLPLVVVGGRLFTGMSFTVGLLNEGC